MNQQQSSEKLWRKGNIDEQMFQNNNYKVLINKSKPIIIKKIKKWKLKQIKTWPNNAFIISSHEFSDVCLYATIYWAALGQPDGSDGSQIRSINKGPTGPKIQKSWKC